MGSLSSGMRFHKPVWLEVFLLTGDYGFGFRRSKRLRRWRREIHPERVQLNTVSRPPAEAFARPVACKANGGFGQLILTGEQK